MSNETTELETNTEAANPLEPIVRHEGYPDNWVKLTLMISPDGKQIHAVGGDRAPGEGDMSYIGWELLRGNIEPDYRRIYDRFVDVVAAQLHYLEGIDKIDMATAKAEEITALYDGWIERYQNDCIFNAKVKSVVAKLMNSMDANYSGTHEVCCKCNEPTGRCEEDNITDDDSEPYCGDCAIGAGLIEGDNAN